MFRSFEKGPSLSFKWNAFLSAQVIYKGESYHTVDYICRTFIFIAESAESFKKPNTPLKAYEIYSLTYI